jgi:diaminohydroxyphosphoribosylaminopyrimidine deaminase/5-amino-6-(5-phosphoribosylamino)uracil reductase
VKLPPAEERFMRLALREARRGIGRTSPNPAVGAVLVKGGRVVGRGHHARAGAPHAEVAAIRDAGARARGADLYTTLEPCDHFGRTPPCSLAILEAGVRRVVSGSSDPNPQVNGRGIRRLRRAGVAVETGLLRAACDAVIEPWARFITTGRPHVTLKVASTLDGRIATAGGDSRWVTGAESRALVHRLRDASDAVLVGAGTARADDPRLTTRLPGGRGRDPIRVVLDSRLALPPGLRLFRQRSASPTIVAHVAGTPPGSPPRGVEYLRCKARRGRVDLEDLLSRLGKRGVTTLLVEGGAEVSRSLLERGLVDRLALFLAPKLAGGGLSWLPGKGPGRMADALALQDMEVRNVGGDLLVTGRPAPKGARTPRVD